MIKLKRFKDNPIIKPNLNNWWEARSVFNPGVYFDGKKVHMLYRAMGDDRISRLGYAYSTDGIHFKGFSKYPAFESEKGNPYERLGCEDPRITKIDDTIYITYTAAAVYPANKPKEITSTSFAPFMVRVSLLSTKDFSSYKRHGILMPNKDSKDAVLFPEKISGKYAMLHRIKPYIWIAYSKDLKKWYGHKVVAENRNNFWESRKIGAGTNILKTEYGWLNFYHGVDKDKVYRLGIMVLDLKDPSKVIYRSDEPIFEPQKTFEKKGFVDNVVFATGAIEKDDNYLIYYGASDKYICMAHIEKEKILKEISKKLKAR